MALPTSVVDVPIGGLREDTAPELVQPGSFLLLNNYVMRQSGAIEKRAGYGRLGSSIAGLGVERVIPYGAELLAVSAASGGFPSFYSWAPSANSGSGSWVTKTVLPNTKITRTKASRAGVVASVAQVVPLGGLYFVFWYSVGTVGTGLLYSVQDASTGASVRLERLITPGTTDSPPVIPGCTGPFFAFSAQAAAVQHVRMTGVSEDYVLRVLVVGLASLTEVTTSLVTGIWYAELHAIPLDGSRFAVAYILTRDRTVLTVEIYDAVTLALIHTTTVSTAAEDLVSWSLAYSNVASVKTLYVSWVESADALAVDAVYCQPLDGTTLASLHAAVLVEGPVAKAVNLRTCCSALGHVLVTVGIQTPATTDIEAFTVDCVTRAGAPFGFRQRTYNWRAVSVPFELGGRVYVLLNGGPIACIDETLLIEQDSVTHGGMPARLVGLADSFSIALSIPDGPSMGAAYPIAGMREVVLAYVESSTGHTSDSASDVPGGVDVLAIDFRREEIWTVAPASEVLTLSGGLSTVVDGEVAVEAGFLLAPGIKGYELVDGALTNSNIKYVCTFEWYDARGNLYQSAPCDPTTVAFDGSVHVNIVLTIVRQPLTLTGRNLSSTDTVTQALHSAQIAVFRTLSTGELPYYRITPRGASFGEAGFLQNGFTAATVTLTDDRTDAQVITLGLGQLYTSGDVLANDPPPPSLHVLAAKQRVWLISAVDPWSVWFSKLLVAGEGPAYSAGFYLRLDDSPDGCTALAALDDAVILFTPNRIYRVVGDGPNDAGQGSFAGPFPVTTDTGCLDARSVLSFPGGVVFQGADHVLYMLGRDLTVARVGGVAQATVATWSTIVSASLDVARQRCVFLCTDSTEAQKPVFLVFDYRHGLWYTWTAHSSYAPVSSALWQGAHVWSAGQRVFAEGRGTYPGWDTTSGIDGAAVYTWVLSSWTTPWLRVGSVSGFQRLRRIGFQGTRYGTFTWGVSLQVDYDTANVQTAVLGPISSGVNVREQIHVARQKCSALRIHCADDGPSDAYAGNPVGSAMVSLAIEIGAKLGSAKLPATGRA